MKIFIKKNILGIIIGVVIGITSVVIAESINSSEVLYDNSDSVSNDTTVKGALDSLFDIVDHSSTGFSLLAHNPVGLSTELIDGYYRYQGVQDANNNVDNYICFGTNDKNTCINNMYTFMYRIIGINTNGQIKLIKKDALNPMYQWNTSNGVEWPNSSLFAGLNGDYFLNNDQYFPSSSWRDKIIETNWHYYTSSNINISSIGSGELNADSVTAKIGIMYIHDYADSISPIGYSSSSWIHFLNNYTNFKNSSFECTISRKNGTQPWMIQSNGSLTISNASDGTLTATHPVRPVFLINSGERIASGSGTLSDPYILEDVS